MKNNLFGCSIFPGPCFLGFVILIGLSSGCIHVQEHLTLRADGSGNLVLLVQSAGQVPQASFLGYIMNAERVPDYLRYPPSGPEDVARLFPGPDFNIQVEESESQAAEQQLRAEVEFKDVNALLASPYGKAISLTLARKEESLEVTALSPLWPPLIAATNKSQGVQKDFQYNFGFSLAASAKEVEQASVEFKITLPAAITGSSGSHEGDTARWVFDRTQVKGAQEAAELLSRPMRAACRAANIQFIPVSPQRPALNTFQGMQEGPVMSRVTEPDEKRILASGKFVPYRLKVIRHFEMAGQNFWMGNVAMLVGAMILPPELRPLEWGPAELDEVVDGRGNRLRSLDAEHAYNPPSYAAAMAEDTEEDETAEGDVRHPVSFLFKVPDRQALEIKHIKGHVNLFYAGGSQIVKLEKIIPKEAVKKTSKETEDAAVHSGSDHRPLTFLGHPRLAELGFSIQSLDATASEGLLMLTLQTDKTQNVLLEAHVFDSHGHYRPSYTWTWNGLEEADYNTTLIAVFGVPEAPLSLALELGRAEELVKFPILLEHVPLSGAVTSNQ